MTRSDPESELVVINNRVRAQVEKCSKCSARDRTSFVGGYGTSTATVMVVDLMPGPDDRTAPLMNDKHGALLHRQLVNARLMDVYVTTLLKCRPTGAVDTDDLEVCRASHLHREITAVRPRVILALGDVVSHALGGVASINGQGYIDYPKVTFRYFKIPVIPLPRLQAVDADALRYMAVFVQGLSYARKLIEEA